MVIYMRNDIMNLKVLVFIFCLSSANSVNKNFKSISCNELPKTCQNTNNESTNLTIFKKDETNLCRYRDFDLYTKEVWNYIIPGFCYFYTLPSRLEENKLTIGGKCWPNTNMMVPVIQINSNHCEFFDHDNKTIVDEIIAPTFKNQLFVDQWLECVDNGIECCEKFDDNEYNIFPTDEYPCPALWDGWQCWKSSKSDTTSSQECPIYSFTAGERVCNAYSHKYCFPNGTWNHQTNTSGCAVAPVYRQRHSYHIIVLSISTGLTFPAVIIFLAFSKLRVPKDWETFNLPLYRNLLISILIKNILVIISKDAVVLQSLDINSSENSVSVLKGNGVWCRILAFVDNLSKNYVFTCMVVIGYFLHKSIARLFSKDINIKMTWLYLGVLGISLIPSLTWAIVTVILNNKDCWMVDENGYQWITDGFKFFILSINLLLLLDILRVLFIGRVNTNRENLKAAVKATLFLIPLFGVPLLLTGQRSLFDSNSCSDVYYYVSYTIEASQGVFVAVLFCYLNKKVQEEILKKYNQFAINLEQRYNIKLWRSKNGNRMTTLTNIQGSLS